MKILKFFGKYFLNLAIALDQFANAVGGGDRDEPISSRLGRIKTKHGGRIPWKRPLAKIIDFGLDKIDPGHSIDAIESDEGSDGVFDKPPED